MSVLAHCRSDDEHGPHEWELDGVVSHCIGTPRGYRFRPSYPFREPLAPERIEWGATLCSRTRCVETAVLAVDGWPFCLDHGDDEVERAVAFELNPAAVALMPAVDDR